MHMVIRVVVEAHSMKSAVENAKSFFDSHLHYQEGGPFDYCTPMVEGHTVSGADRWVDYADEDVAFPLGSDAGRAEVEDAWKATCDYMEDNLEALWEVMDEAESFADFVDTILADEDLVRHKMSKVAGYNSTDYFLYVQGWNTGGIRSERGWEYTEELLDEAEEQQDLDGDEIPSYWVVPLDVHY